MRTALALLIVACAVMTGSAQLPPRDAAAAGVAMAGSAVVTGTVVADDEVRAPLRHATVTLSRSGIEDIRTTSTDDRGRFQFGGLPAGAYTVNAGKGGYVTVGFGAAQPGMPAASISLTDGQQFSTTPIALMRGAVIAGRLIDRGGRPAPNVQVQAVQFVMFNGERRRRTTPGSSGTSLTNAHGDYRIYGLRPGEYLVYTTALSIQEVRDLTVSELTWAQQPTGPAPAQGRPFSYAPSIYPGTPDASSATPVIVGRGEERLGLDFSLQYVPVSRVTGTVIAPDGRPAPGIPIWRNPKQTDAMFPGTTLLFRTGADGTFVLPNVPPGEFVITALGAPATGPAAQGLRAAAAGPQFWGMTDVSVSGQDLLDLAIRLQPGMLVTGKVVVTGTGSASPIDLSRVQLRLVPHVGGVVGGAGGTSASPGADGSFRIEGVMPGPFRLTATVSGAPGTGGGAWMLRSALHDGKDVIDVPLDVRPSEDVSGLVVTFTDAKTELSGTLTDTAGRPMPQLFVFAFPVDRAYWTPGSRRIGSARAGVSGSYAITGLPPGEYYVCALTQLENSLQYDPTYLEQFVPASLKITLGEGEKRTQHLRVGG